MNLINKVKLAKWKATAGANCPICGAVLKPFELAPIPFTTKTYVKSWCCPKERCEFNDG